MKLWRLLVPVVLIFPALAPAASREILELQRDVALLQEQLRVLKSSQDEKLGAIQALVQQALEAANKANTSAALLQDNIRDTQTKALAPVADVGAKIDQVTTDVQALRESVNDIASQVGKLQQQMTDVSNAVRTIGSPAAAPPPATGAPTGPGAAVNGAPPIPAETLYQNAMRDRSGGKDDLALQEFTDYLRYYGNTDLAPNAQFYIAEIHLKQNNPDDALREFDLVLEKYPDNTKTADALYMKGRTLLQLGKRTQAKQEFCELAKRFPANDLASRARSQVKSLGLTCGPATPARARKRS